MSFAHFRFGIDEFLASLGETIVWCNSSLNVDDPQGSLRSSELLPPVLAPDPGSSVSDVLQARSFALRLGRTRPASSLEGGFLLCYEPDQNLADGAAAFSSKGYFDDDNVPPWDTWIAYATEQGRHGFLVSWVPPAFKKLADEGLVVNPEQCIWDLQGSGTQLEAALKARGIAL